MAPKTMTRNMTLKKVLNTYDVDALSTTMPRIVDSAPCTTGMPSAPSALRMRWFPVSPSSITKAYVMWAEKSTLKPTHMSRRTIAMPSRSMPHQDM
ncbi:hypothetical protein NP493_712g01008 [Ridgeia piscesae]|uniref:Uncharacterized protein n=1 Tax=Ridgeia piscesae TaxID=27915 RepID=A0AAD9KQK2_RIDPI|nr:hypothetical protein NP493_712g01008 [Ridgeia piscesae]